MLLVELTNLLVEVLELQMILYQLMLMPVNPVVTLTGLIEMSKALKVVKDMMVMLLQQEQEQLVVEL